MIQVFTEKPLDFSPKVEIGATYVIHNERLLLLKLGSHKQEAGYWGVPAGKIEINETFSDGAKRELFEETGLSSGEGPWRSLGVLFMRKPDIDYTYHFFELRLETEPQISLSIEHDEHIWASAQDIKNLPLMKGAYEALEAYVAAT